jgi:hypothetical protein
MYLNIFHHLVVRVTIFNGMKSVLQQTSAVGQFLSHLRLIQLFNGKNLNGVREAQKLKFWFTNRLS